MKVVTTFLLDQKRALLAVLLILAGMTNSVASPVLNFSDLISGPDAGLGDGQGTGVIVTVWGQNLGGAKGSSKLYFRDSAGVVREPYVYYWKVADGQLPGGPADLHASHRMQEVAFSIPDSALGAGEMFVVVGGQASNSLPFSVRAGNIYHVKSNGSDSNPGTFERPWRSVGRGVDNGVAPAGSTIYIHDVDHGSQSSARGIYFRNAPTLGTQDNQTAVVPYPGFQPSATGIVGVMSYQSEGNVIAKMRIYASNCDEVANGQRTNCEDAATNGVTAAVRTNAWGRTVANYVAEPAGRCSSSSNGAIFGNALNANQVSGHKLYGNEIDGYGCPGSNKLHHTTYLSVRSTDGEIVTPWEFGWNYLHDNHTKNGIHNYDENDGCGNLNGDLLIHDNVVVNQGGAGIAVGSTCGWSMDARIYNNVLINTGNAAAWDGVDVGTTDGPHTSAITIGDSGLMGTMHIYNNTIYGWNTDDAPGSKSCLGFQGSNGDNVRVLFNANICYTELDRAFLGAGYRADNKLDNVSGSDNVFFYAGSGASSSSVAPDWDVRALTVDPMVELGGVQINIVSAGSPLIDRISSRTERDIFGNSRGPQSSVGAVEFMLSPPSFPSAFEGRPR
jgi:hypothetical protein